MEDLVKLVNDTIFEVKRPKFLLVLRNPNDWEKIKNGVLYKYQGCPEMTIHFVKCSEHVFYTLWTGNGYPLMKVIYKILGHNNFFFSEIQPFIEFEDS